MKANGRTMRRANALLHRLGLHLSTRDQAAKGYVLHGYEGADGRFDYARYKAVQEAGNRRKIDWVFAQEENIAAVADYLRARLPSPARRGLCHGTRRGMEQKWFAERLAGAEVIGTEISDTATDFPNTLQWDFHETKVEWAGAFDFVYSNSLDHAYDPQKALGAWVGCLKPGGFVVLEHTELHDEASATELDPFGADLRMMPWLIARWAQGRYALVDLWAAPKASGAHGHFLCIQPVPLTG